jgi:hypothetical protein
MQKLIVRALSLVILGLLISSCGNAKEDLISEACTKLQSAWDNQKLPSRFEHYAAASKAFRNLAAIDSGFAKYASLASEAANNAVTDYTAYYEMMNFCGVR